jgi:uncharacterized protein (DUF1697 family)
MKKLAVLLRAVNLAGRNKVPMAHFAKLLTDVGYDPVQTVLNSGNAVVGTTTSAAAVATAVRRAIADQWELDIAVAVRTHAQLRKIIERNPMAEHLDRPSYLHVAFFAGKPGRAKDLPPDRWAPDEYVIDGEEIFLWYPNGSGRSKMNLAAIEKAVGAVCTARNWNTVTKLAELTA